MSRPARLGDAHAETGTQIQYCDMSAEPRHSFREIPRDLDPIEHRKRHVKYRRAILRPARWPTQLIVRAEGVEKPVVRLWATHPVEALLAVQDAHFDSSQQRHRTSHGRNRRPHRRHLRGGRGAPALTFSYDPRLADGAWRSARARRQAKLTSSPCPATTIAIRTSRTSSSPPDTSNAPANLPGGGQARRGRPAATTPAGARAGASTRNDVCMRPDRRPRAERPAAAGDEQGEL